MQQLGDSLLKIQKTSGSFYTLRRLSMKQIFALSSPSTRNNESWFIFHLKASGYEVLVKQREFQTSVSPWGTTQRYPSVRAVPSELLFKYKREPISLLKFKLPNDWLFRVDFFGCCKVPWHLQSFRPAR
jgi:hypothetical protein